jgi:dihydrofolate synthase/folylpolyglutamate synthase
MTSGSPPAGYAATQDYLFGLKSAGVKFGVDRMRLLSALLGNPERKVPCIHVAGTNGKGSVAAMLEAILRASGQRTGLYTSPHLVRLGERVQVNRGMLTEEEITAFAGELKPLADSLASKGGPDDRPTFFEFMTAMAFLQFVRRGCTFSVIEVGLGGRLDATNIVEPEVSVVTSIGLDHCEMLGNTFEAIAGEKAGVIKPGRPVVIGRVPLGAETTLRRVAASRGSRLVSVREEYGDDVERYPRTSLEGDYQRWNAATATLAARLLPPAFGVTQEAIESGLGAVDWPGRWQRTVLGGRLAILDASHNPEGAGVLEFEPRPSPSRDRAPSGCDRRGTRGNEGGPAPRGPFPALPRDPPRRAAPGAGDLPRRARGARPQDVWRTHRALHGRGALPLAVPLHRRGARRHHRRDRLDLPPRRGAEQAGAEAGPGRGPPAGFLSARAQASRRSSSVAGRSLTIWEGPGPTPR